MDPIQQPITPSYAPVPPAPQEVPVQQTVPEIKYAGFWIRFAAYVLDSIAINIVVIPVSFLSGAIVGFTNAPGAGGELGGALGGIAGGIIGWSYLIIMTHKKAATLGKMAFDLKVISEDGTRLTLGKIFLRETVGKIVSGLIIMIGYIMAAFTEKKQALHDKFASSVVVYNNPAQKPRTALAAVVIVLACVLPLIVIGVLFVVITTSMDSAREKENEAMLRASSTNAQIQAEVDAEIESGL
jgi:uncharacterized RDD family membrane protein YckC